MTNVLGFSVLGLGLAASGVLYLLRPNLFRRGMWMKRSIMIRKLSPEAYVTYMRILGLFNIVLGLALVVYAAVSGLRRP